MTAAGLDIGTNTILMVVAEVHDDGTYTVLHDMHRIPRLGQGVDASGKITEEAIGRAIDVLREYRTILDAAGSPPTLCVATSAVRDAANRDEVVQRLQDVIKAPVWAIEGHAEAELTFLGTVGSHTPDAVVIDIGGGSTEYVRGALGKPEFLESVNIGALRLTERFLVEKPVAEEQIASLFDSIDAALIQHLSPIQGCGVPVYAVAGTPVALASLSLGLGHYERSALEGYRLTLAEVEQRTSSLLSMGLNDLRALPGIAPNRADILPAGSAILYRSMLFLGVQEVIVSTQGLRYGIMRVASAETT